MRLLVLTCVLAACSAQRPCPCTSPSLLTGALTMSTQSEELWTYALYMYDALGERIRLYEIGTYKNTSFTYDVLLLYKEGVLYEIDSEEQTCVKQPLKMDFHPLAIPKNASLLGQAVLGSSSGPGQGMLVNTWSGEVPPDREKYMITVTEFGCIPVSFVYHDKRFGWTLTSYFNNVIGMSDPNVLFPPKFCENAMSRKEPADFFSVLMTKK